MQRGGLCSSTRRLRLRADKGSHQFYGGQQIHVWCQPMQQQQQQGSYVTPYALLHPPTLQGTNMPPIDSPMPHYPQLYANTMGPYYGGYPTGYFSPVHAPAVYGIPFTSQVSTGTSGNVPQMAETGDHEPTPAQAVDRVVRRITSFFHRGGTAVGNQQQDNGAPSPMQMQSKLEDNRQRQASPVAAANTVVGTPGAHKGSEADAPPTMTNQAALAPRARRTNQYIPPGSALSNSLSALGFTPRVRDRVARTYKELLWDFAPLVFVLAYVLPDLVDAALADGYRWYVLDQYNKSAKGK